MKTVARLPVPIILSFRYLFPKRGSFGKNIVSFLAVLSVMLSTLFSILSIAASNGANNEITTKLSGIDSHILVTLEATSNYDSIIGHLSSIPGIQSVSPYIQVDVQMETFANPNPRVLLLKGILPEHESATTDIESYITFGNLRFLHSKDSLVLPMIVGSRILNDQELKNMDTVLIRRIHGLTIKTYAGKVVGGFHSGSANYDNGLAYIPLALAQLIKYEGDNLIDGFCIKTINPSEPQTIVAKIKHLLPDPWLVEDWKSRYGDVFSGIELLQYLSLVQQFWIFVLAVTCIGCIIGLIINQKRRDIATLITIGMKPFSIQLGLTLLGLLVGAIGLMFAAPLGIILSNYFNEHKIFQLPEGAFLISYLPFHLHWTDVFLVIVTAMLVLSIVAFLTTTYVYRLIQARFYAMNNITGDIKVEGLAKSYPIAGSSQQVLQNVNFVVNKGQIVSLTGPSGSGKTTLLNIISCLDKADSGTFSYGSFQPVGLPNTKLVEFRNKHIGFVFQRFNLLQDFTALENVMIPNRLSGVRGVKAIDRAKECLKQVALENFFRHKPSELSAGQMQRVAIARAIVNNPQVILADEPTGNLDEDNAKQIFGLLKGLSNCNKITIIIATHNQSIANGCDRNFELKEKTLHE